MFLSASRIKTLSFCSWAYYASYVLKMRDAGNPGSKRGTVTHAIAEYLQGPRHKKAFDFCYKNGSKKHPGVNRLVKILAKRLDIGDEENVGMIFDFIDVALKADFFCEGYELFEPEKTFKIESENPEYKILGFIDKSGKNKDEVLIVDYKTSKQKFSGKDKDFNIQALTYALALSKEFPEFETIKVKFLFLKFKKAPEQNYTFDKKELAGFETYLSQVYKYAKNFNVKKACSNFARNKKETFRLCGKGKDDLKVDGTPAWVCPYKLPSLYYELRDEVGNLVTSSQDKNYLDKSIKDGYTVVEKMYLGCPAWYKY